MSNMEIVYFTILCLFVGLVMTYVLTAPIRYVPHSGEKMTSHFDNLAEFGAKLAIVVDTCLLLIIFYFAYTNFK